MSLIKKTSPAQSAGFTLIELLVALILLSFIFLLLLSSLQFGMKIWSSKQVEPFDISEVLAVQGLLRPVLSGARPIMIEVDKSNRPQVLFEGTSNSIRFLAPMTKQFGMGGLFEVTVYLTEGDESGGRFEMSWRRFRPGPSSAALDENHVELIHDVTEIQFAYFGSRERGQPARWYSDWKDQQYLPELIRLRLNRGDHAWPELVVAPRVRSENLIMQNPDPDSAEP
jgi:general secretion pathway protein J